jgi:hypothetical protein
MIYGSFNSDPVIFYRGNMIAIDERPIEAMAAKIVPGGGYVIMTEQAWQEMRQLNANLPAPIVRSKGSGPEGDAPLVLLQARVS